MSEQKLCVPFLTVAVMHDMLCVQKFQNQASQIGDERPLSACAINTKSNRLVTGSWVLARSSPLAVATLLSFAIIFSLSHCCLRVFRVVLQKCGLFPITVIFLLSLDTKTESRTFAGTHKLACRMCVVRVLSVVLFSLLSHLSLSQASLPLSSSWLFYFIHPDCPSVGCGCTCTLVLYFLFFVKFRFFSCVLFCAVAALRSRQLQSTLAPAAWTTWRCCMRCSRRRLSGGLWTTVAPTAAQTGT